MRKAGSPHSELALHTSHHGASQAARWQRIHLPMQEQQQTRVWSLGREDALEEEMATHSGILA